METYVLAQPSDSLKVSGQPFVGEVGGWAGEVKWQEFFFQRPEIRCGLPGQGGRLGELPAAVGSWIFQKVEAHSRRVCRACRKIAGYGEEQSVVPVLLIAFEPGHDAIELNRHGAVQAQRR